ncbi:MAG: 3-phosphoshikimate 1-carboxyvinyltransferase [Endomicrobiales bacterium]|nr:3-phosphoshikimate 1-carboxyvinyltransferase [Endomicrobiales bacterium]
MDWIIKPFDPGHVIGIKEISVPADKSITHRAVMLGALCEGEFFIQNYLSCDDCSRTIQAFRDMGVEIEKAEYQPVLNDLQIQGVGLKGLKPPKKPIDAGNSGTTVRLLSGILAGQGFEAEIIGDESLSRRPMKRIIEPLRQMGVEISARDDNYLPLKIKGNPRLKPIKYESKIASAQVKSCVVFAGMQAEGKTTFTEPYKSRNHTEKFLQALGINVEVDGLSVSVTGPVRFPKNKVVLIPRDISAAAFFMVAGAILRHADFRLLDIGFNETRDGILEVLKKMNAKITLSNPWKILPEEAANIEVKSSDLKPTDITGEMVPRLIDEIPVIALAATQAKGTTTISGAKELRVKESDRLSAISTELNKMGANIEEKEDGLVIHGPTPLTGSEVDSHGDHRIAMTMAIAALVSKGETKIKNAQCVNISFPDFAQRLKDLGADIKIHE